MSTGLAERKITDVASYNLAKESDRSKCLSLWRESRDTFGEISNSLENYLLDGTLPSFRYGDILIFKGVDYTCLVRKNIVYSSYVRFDIEALCVYHHRISTDVNSRNRVGIILDRPIILDKVKYKKTLLRRGDEDYNVLVSDLAGSWPTVSFSCFAQMFHDSDSEKNIDKVFSALANKKIDVVDFLPDERFEATKEEKAQAIAAQRSHHEKPMPIGKPGFTYVDGEWHRSSTVLLREKRKASYIFGQDEGTYFGCKLKDNPKTVAAAFTSLIPKDVKGKSFIRQGEWFVVAVDEKEVPPVEKCIVAIPYGIALPVESKESNLHIVESDLIDGTRLSRSGVLYCKDGYMEHDEHATIQWKNWVRFYRNTALKSVSASANVD